MSTLSDFRGHKTFNFAVSEYSKYVDKFTLPRSMLAHFLWNCHLQMLHTRNANIEGGGEARNGKDRVSVFTTPWKYILKWLVLKSPEKVIKDIFVLFSDLDNQPYTFSRKIESKRRLIWKPRNGLWYVLHYGLHILNCTFTVSVDEPETDSYHFIR